jgi:hypothetical protein
MSKGLPFFIEKCFRVLPCGHRIVFVQIAIAMLSLSFGEKLALRFEADLPPRFLRDAGRKLFFIFFTQLANLSACVDIYV